MRWPRVFVAVAGFAACGDGLATGPFDGLPIDGNFAAEVTAPVHVARDRYGVAHIHAATLGDAAFVQGYVMAHDRLPQMDVLRRYGAGTLAELFGETFPAVIDSDLEMRMHQMRPLAEATLAQLQASGDPTDAQVALLLVQFAAGVNRYAKDLKDGLWTIDPRLADRFDPARFAAWSPVDSLVIARFHAFSQSWSAPFELGATELYNGLRQTFDDASPSDAAASARRGISRDLLRLAPVGNTPTIDGFPNVASDTGSRSDGSGPVAPAATPSVPVAAAAAQRPEVPSALFDAARALFGGGIRNGPFGELGPHAFVVPLAGGNAWAVGPALAGPGRAMLAADQQLPLTDPAMFYPTHLIVTGDQTEDGNASGDVAPNLLDVMGVTIPGIPGVMFGHNGDLAWSGVASEHDVTDVYLEQIAPCSGTPAVGDCVAWTDPEGTSRSVLIDRVTETIGIGTLGTVARTQAATYEIVPHHGPILPAIDRVNHALVPRPPGAALSVRYTGYQPTFELRALYNLARAHTIEDGLRATADMTYGSQSWMMIDQGGHIGWTTHAYVPIRTPASYAWNPDTHQDELAPFLVLPGGGDADWLEGRSLSPRVVPHAIDPARGYLVAANADPVGATADGLPLNQGSVDGDPLYAGVSYAAGLRDERITTLVQQRAAVAPLTLDDMAAIQRDTRSLAGAKLTPAIVAALDRLDRTTVGPFDVNPYLDGLGPDDAARLVTARAVMTAWTFATPAAIDARDGDSAATALFHAWIHFFIARTLADELDAIHVDVWWLDDDQLVRIVHALLTDPKSFVTSPSTQQPILCDNYRTAGPDDSCTKVILQAMVDAMTYLESPQAFGTQDTSAWRWGLRHTLVIDGSADAGVPRSGDNSSVTRSDPSWQDRDASEHTGGAALRFLAQAAGGGPISVKWSLPGGAIDDSRSPHHRDLLDGYLSDTMFDAAFSIDEIVAAGESRWVFH